MEYIVLVLMFLTIKQIQGDENEKLRWERHVPYIPPLVYPVAGNFKMLDGVIDTIPKKSLTSLPNLQRLIVGVAVPVQLSGRILVYGQNFQFQYALPTNATFFTNFFEDSAASRRRRKSIAGDERMTVYKLLEREFERKNIDGRNCLKKSICQAAETPIKDEGLVGELLHLLLTPDDKSTSAMYSEYFEAAENGRKRGNCSMIYATCPTGEGILDHISILT